MGDLWDAADGGRGDDDREAWDAERAQLLRTETREPVRLMLEAWDRDLDEMEVTLARGYVAGRGFNPDYEVPVDPRVWGIEYEGRVYGPGDTELSGTAHYLAHAVALEQWPEDTPEHQYYDDLAEIVLDRDSAVFASRFRDESTGAYRPQIGFIGRSEDRARARYMRGEGGARDVLVEFRLDEAHVATGFQLADARAHVERQAEEGRRRDLEWLRR
jgi:hypothetical protein